MLSLIVLLWLWMDGLKQPKPKAKVDPESVVYSDEYELGKAILLASADLFVTAITVLIILYKFFL